MNRRQEYNIKYLRIYYKKNRKKLLKNKRNFYLKNKKKIKIQHNILHFKFPWRRPLMGAKQRCENPNNSYYKDWGGRGIEFHLTMADGEYLWNRDKAWLLQNPSLDRKDNDGNYIVDNCRFIEMEINRIKDKEIPIIQYDLQMNFIKEWKSIAEACRKLHLNLGSVHDVLNRKRNHTHKFIFRYKNES
jgi:hypothetical protein